MWFLIHIIDNTYLSQDMGVIKVSNSESDLQPLKVTGGNGAIRNAAYDFLLIFHCNYVYNLQQSTNNIHIFRVNISFGKWTLCNKTA